MSAASVQRAMYTSPIELLYRWNQYQEERKKFEGFESNFPPNVLPGQPVNPPPKNDDSSEAKWLFGLTGAMFFVVLLLALLPFIIAIYLLVKHGDRMPQWAKIAGWICALLPVPGGSIIAIILVFSTKSKE
jgi:hypothetical protein